MNRKTLINPILNIGKQMLPFWLKKVIIKSFLQKNLYKRLPLDHPVTIHIDPSNICNFKCVFCPTGDTEILKKVSRVPCLMKFDLFKKVIDDFTLLLKKQNSRLYCIHLYKDGEPLLNPFFSEMVRYAKKSRIANCISTTTNGSLITRELALEIVSSGLDQIRISIEHVNDEGYRKISKSNVSYEEILSKVNLLNCVKRQIKSRIHIIVKITDTGFSSDQLNKFKKDFSPVCDELRIDTLMGWSNSTIKDFTMGKEPQMSMDGTTRIHKQLVCPDPFSKLSVNSNGTVSACCVDWSHGVVTGNVLNDSIENIWNGEKLRKIRILHLSGCRDRIEACANCQYVNGTSNLEDLDLYREKLIKSY